MCYIEIKTTNQHTHTQIDENVLVIGGSVSGLDLVISLSNVVKSLTLSVKKRPNDTEELRKKRQQTLPAKTILKYNVQRFTADGAEFIDGTRQTFTAVIFATGKYQIHRPKFINGVFSFSLSLSKQSFNQATNIRIHFYPMNAALISKRTLFSHFTNRFLILIIRQWFLLEYRTAPIHFVYSIYR